MSKNWLNNAIIPYTTTSDSQVIFAYSDIDQLTDDELTPDFSSLFIGEFTKYASSLIAYPIDLTKNKMKGKLNYSLRDTNIDCYATSNIDNMGYYLGEYLIEGDDYTDYEPYTQLKVFLPFYNWVDIPIADVINKYMQFRLIVDYKTGSAQYIIGVNYNSVECPNPPYMIGVNDKNTRVVGVYNFQLGSVIPIGNSGATDMVRNTLLGAIKLGGALAVGAWNVAAGAGIATSTTVTSPTKVTENYKNINPESGRLRITKSIDTKYSSQTMQRTSDYTNRVKAYIRSETFANSMNVLSNLQVSPSVDKSNNTNLNRFMSHNIIILIKKSVVRPVGASYGHIYGFPLGEIKRLGTLTGYTEISSVHIEGEEFNLATQEEMSMLNEILTAGIIL